ncbi:MAG: sxtJ [Candidatus Omnitrophica bacterium]|nr:sxtJ [Candidatus Omnitrophota bacterium]
MIKQTSPSQAPIKELRGFGVGMTLFCAALGGLLFWRGSAEWAYRLWIIGGVVFLAPAILFPRGLRPIFIVWTAIAKRLSWVISRIVLLLIFFVLFTFVSLIQKIIRRDPLERKFPGDESSYWIDRSKEEYNPNHFERLF